MPIIGIANPAGAFGLPLTNTNLGGATVMTNDFVALEYKNNAASALAYGAVVVTDVTGLLATTTTTANAAGVIGVVAQESNQVPSGNNIIVINKGVARVNIGSNTVAVGDLLQSSTTAGVATTAGTSGSTAWTTGTFAQALEASSAKDSNNCIRALLK